MVLAAVEQLSSARDINVYQSHNRPASPPRSSEEPFAEHIQHLAELASQHHTSEYNCLKFGLRGAPVQYVPLCVQAPDYYKQLQDQQARYADTQAWWPCQNLPGHTVQHSHSIPKPSDASRPQMNVPNTSSGLQKELLSAISSPLIAQASPPSDRVGTDALAVKTSSTHPINISYLIPIELIPLISSHLAETTSHHTPTLFDIPAPLQLYRLTSRPSSSSKPPPLPPSPSPSSWNLSPVPPIAKSAQSHLHSAIPRSPHQQNSSSDTRLHSQSFKSSMPIPAISVPRQSGLVNFLWNQKIVKTSKAVIATTSVGFKIPGLPAVPQISIPANPPDVLPTVNGHREGNKKTPHPISGATKRKLSVSLLPGSKKEDMAHVQLRQAVQSVSVTVCTANNVQITDVNIQGSDSGSATTTTFLDGIEGSPDRRKEILPQVIVPSQRRSFEFTRSISEPLPTLISPSSQLWEQQRQRTPSVLGNLLLSSCPGKKVRLGGPVHGRGAVCRDLRQDLQRIRDMGVGCVVCCLDDDELHYLGAPWDEYACIADQVGLDVLRIPIPEGLAPPSAKMLDDHLNRLIKTYTLAGIPILVHCRGGVGRAGLVACCWALKLGLCGWTETVVPQPSMAVSNPTSDSDWDMTSSGLQHGEPKELFPAVASSCDGSTDSRGRCAGDNGENDSAAGTGRPVLADHMHSTVREDTMQLVERAISLVRRRRSAKAVETFEQVWFLVEYVDFLRTKGRSEGDESGKMKGDVRIGSVLQSDMRVNGGASV